MKSAPYYFDGLASIDVRVRLRRTGREEWLDNHANPTEDSEQAASFVDAIAAILFAQSHVDEPKLWHWEHFVVIS